jgi:hypothetical protein
MGEDSYREWMQPTPERPVPELPPEYRTSPKSYRSIFDKPYRSIFDNEGDY